MRRRILALVVGVTVLVVLAFVVPLAFLVRSAVEQQAVAKAVGRAESVARYLRLPGVDRAGLQSYLSQLPQTADSSTSVTFGGQTIGTLPPVDTGEQDDVPGGPGGGRIGNPPPSSAGTGGPGNETEVRTVPGGRLVIARVSTTSGFARVDVWLSEKAIDAGLTRWWALLGGASAGLIALAVVAGEILTRRIVRPLVRTAQTAHALSAGDITARAPTSGPREIAEVGSSLNRLADRIDELIAEERETVADMSHRMRTPLTALRLDAEALQDGAEAERIGAHVTALERTLTAVIRAARRPQREGLVPSADATAVVGKRVLFWSALTDEQDRARSLALPSAPLPVRASEEDLAAAVDALLENVIAHTPEGTPFAVRLAPYAGGAVLEVSDDGPGLPEGAGVRGRSDRGSSGLGLDIARRCAEASGGTITFGRTAAGGARITLELGAP